jgi:hypothetical protein
MDNEIYIENNTGTYSTANTEELFLIKTNAKSYYLIRAETREELIGLCVDFLKHNGYNVSESIEDEAKDQ